MLLAMQTHLLEAVLVEEYPALGLLLISQASSLDMGISTLISPADYLAEIGLGAYVSRTNCCETAQCNCDLGNRTVIHVLLDCPLNQDEHNLVRNALYDQGIALRRDELLPRSDARTIVAEFIVKTGPLGQFQAVDPTTLGVEEGDE
ncbi:uncharacterized protein BDW43DRAFT_313447 [Aspergillus alliaceus]|uniref:uncharacterized protein n=1 Tax=Petromyces alliaceus TaxID=209559 RepID=UPI0012A716C6|nr:uncharacterized protein BDW43DRAFT_313447 [Aspergillus alliaceus]KAB8231122.1 hypothetical protein BDW43DRAFT_313447 [Aspergillus alliaceus]